ncbi:MAG: hypothetical protein CBB71_20425 [Rhodopirellula sp. TMED11]|nr:MAG: hypothetical protein CBB71_20425 [Rhodopirellula sp. TMED11]
MLLPLKRTSDQAVGRKQQLIFLHIPKCGGTFVQKTFAPFSSQCPLIVWKEARGHRTYQDYKRVFDQRNDDVHDYFIMTVVRNPWAWHVSWFNYIRAPGGGRLSGLKIEHKQFRKMSFSDYLKWLDDDTVKQTAPGMVKMQQSDWICDEQGNVRADAILRQENLLSDVSNLISKLGIDLQPKPCRLNVSTIDDYRKYYDSKGIEQIAQRHQRDLELFGYQFETPHKAVA